MRLLEERPTEVLPDERVVVDEEPRTVPDDELDTELADEEVLLLTRLLLLEDEDEREEEEDDEREPLLDELPTRLLFIPDDVAPPLRTVEPVLPPVV